MKKTFKVATDTATLCLFDLAALKHRIDADGDWWTVPEDELLELNRGNALFLGLGSDGDFSIVIEDSVMAPQTSVVLNFPSGHVFVGAAEEATADGLEPEALRGGGFVDFSPGTYRIDVARDNGVITLAINRTEERGKSSSFTAPICI